MTTILEVKSVTKVFDGVRALDNFSCELKAGSITALIGPNGSGKTTLLNIITGFLQADSGHVFFRPPGGGEYKVDDLAPFEVARLGLSRTFQNTRLFRQMSVMENMLLGARDAGGEGLTSAILQPARMRSHEAIKREKAVALLEQVGLLAKGDGLARDLSQGQRKLLEIARTLMSEVQLLLLDEPTAGLFPETIEKIREIIRGTQKVGTTILFIEHDMAVVRQLSDRVIVLDGGGKVAEGTPDKILNHEIISRSGLTRGSFLRDSK